MNEKHSATNTYTLEFKSEPDVLLDRLEELARDHSESAFELTVTRLEPNGGGGDERGEHPYRDGHAAPGRLRALLRAREREVEDNIAEVELVLDRGDGATTLTVEYLPSPPPEFSEARGEGHELRDPMTIVVGAGAGALFLLEGFFLTLITFTCTRSYALEDIAGMLALAAMSLGIGALMLFATRARVELEVCAAWLRGYYVGQKVDYNLVWEFSPGVRIHRVLDHLRLAELQVDGEGATPREGGREFARGVKAARFAARAIAENAGF